MCKDNLTSKGDLPLEGTTTTRDQPPLQQKFVHIVDAMDILNVSAAPSVVNNWTSHNNNVNNHMDDTAEHTSNN